MMTSIAFFRAVKDALQLPPACEKLVIEAVVGRPLRVYVKGFISKDAIPAIHAALTHVADVGVSDLGEVVVTPLANELPLDAAVDAHGFIIRDSGH